MAPNNRMPPDAQKNRRPAANIWRTRRRKPVHGGPRRIFPPFSRESPKTWQYRAILFGKTVPEAVPSPCLFTGRIAFARQLLFEQDGKNKARPSKMLAAVVRNEECL